MKKFVGFLSFIISLALGALLFQYVQPLDQIKIPTLVIFILILVVLFCCSIYGIKIFENEELTKENKTLLIEKHQTEIEVHRLTYVNRELKTQNAIQVNQYNNLVAQIKSKAKTDEPG